MYLHFWPPHDPYLPRKEFDHMFEDQLMASSEAYSSFISEKIRLRNFYHMQRREYDEYIRYADALLSVLLEEDLESSGRLEKQLSHRDIRPWGDV